VYSLISFEQRGDAVSSHRQSVTVFAPATVANVGSAFDVLGFALDAPGDTITATFCQTPGITVRDISGDGGLLPLDPERNTAAVSARALLDHLIRKDSATYAKLGISLSIQKGLPIGSGLGSSSASTVGGVVATNELLGEPLTRSELLPFAMEGERVACGAAHADNVAPCLLGGFVLIRSYTPLDVIPLPCPASVSVAVVSPQLELRTSDARKVLKRSVPLESAIVQWGNVAALIAGIFRDDAALMGRALADSIIEPERGQLIPGYTSAKLAAREAGALGCAISGSGPALFAICRDRVNAAHVASAMEAAFKSEAGVASTSYISGINTLGAKVINRG
jgi:homoserine kinase